MPYGAPNQSNGPGWMDVRAYLEELRQATGRRWCVVVGATSESSKTEHLLLSVCEFRAGVPVLRDDIGLVSGYWPNPNQRTLDGAVFQLLVRFDRLLEERRSDLDSSAAF